MLFPGSGLPATRVARGSQWVNTGFEPYNPGEICAVKGCSPEICTGEIRITEGRPDKVRVVKVLSSKDRRSASSHGAGERERAAAGLGALDRVPGKHFPQEDQAPASPPALPPSRSREERTPRARTQPPDPAPQAPDRHRERQSEGARQDLPPRFSPRAPPSAHAERDNLGS